MGGNALKTAKTRRFDAEEYFDLWCEVNQMMGEHFVWQTMRRELIPAYAKKETFGDMDILYYVRPYGWRDKETNTCYPLTVEEVKKIFKPTEIVQNGSVISFDYEECQIDLIYSHVDLFDYALGYYSYNDLGNLVGKLARRFGMKHGHDGLWLPIRDDDAIFDEILLTTDIRKTYEFLKLDADKVSEGFEDLDEIFRFVASSPFYDPELYKLENLNHIAKVRDKKRETYRKFLEFGEKYTGPVGQMNPDKKFYLMMVLDHFGKMDEFKRIMEQVCLMREARRVFNGEIVSAVTGLTSKDLGVFVRHLKSDPRFSPAAVVYFGATRVIDNIHDDYKLFRPLA